MPAIKFYFYKKAIPQIMFKMLSALITMTWKFSVDFEEYLLKSTGTYVYKKKMVPAVLHNPFKGNVQKNREKLEKHLL